MTHLQEVSDLINCLPYLECDKATERKKTADKLEKFLSMDNVISWLKNNSQTGLSFTAVFKCVQGYLIKESDIIHKKSDFSSTPRDEAKLAHCSRLLRHVVQVANKNDPEIKCLDFINSVSMILKEKFYCHHFAHTYLDLLATHFFKYATYTRSISSDKYKELLLTCVTLYEEATSPLRAQLLQAVKALLRCIIEQCFTSEHQYFFDFFKTSIHTTRTELSCPIVDDYLWCLYHFSSWQLPSCSDLVSDLGEATLPFVASFLQNKKLSSAGFILTAKYCIQQVNLICGFNQMSVLCTSHSNYIKSAEVFKNIFTAILCKLKSDARSLIRKDSSEVKELVLLASTLLHTFKTFENQDGFEFLDEHDDVATTTQQSQLISNRASLIFFIRLFSNGRNSHAQCIWLQVMEKLVHTYPLDVAETDVKLCSEFLHQVIANSKNEGVLSSAFQLLTSFLQTDAFRKAASSEDFACGLQLWEISKRQACLIKGVLYQPSQIAFDVLAILCSYKCTQLENNDTSLTDTWPVLCLSVFPSRSILQFLCSSLKNNAFMEKRFSGEYDSKKDRYSVRRTLLEWIGGCTDISTESQSETSIAEDSQPLLRLPSLVASLFCDDVYPADPKLVAHVIEGLCSINLGSSLEKSDCLSTIEKSALLQFAVSRFLDCFTRKKEENFEKIYVSTLCDHARSLAHSILIVASEILDKASVDIKVVYAVAYSVHLVALVSVNLNAEFHFENVVLNKIVDSMSMLLDGLPYHSAHDVLKVIQRLQDFVDLYCASKSQKVPAEQFVDLTKLSSLILKWTLDYFSDNTVDYGTQMNNIELCENKGESSLSLRKKRLHDDSISEPPVKYYRLSLDCKRNINHKRSLNLKQTDQQTCIFDVVEHCLLLAEGIAQLVDNEVEQKLFNAVFQTDSFDCHNPEHIQIFLSFIKVFSVHLEALSWFEVSEIVSNAKQILRNHFRNQVVYSKWLATLPALLKILVKFPGESDARDCIASMLSHLKIIEDMLKKDQCNDAVRLALVNCFTDVSSLCAIKSSSFPLSKNQVCEKYLYFLADGSASVVKTCATNSSTIFKLTETDHASTMKFYQDVISVFTTVREKLMMRISTVERWKSLTYVASYLEALWNVVPYSGHAIETLVVFETCHFASLAYSLFTADRSFLLLMQKFLTTFESQSCFYATDGYLSHYLKMVLFKWPNCSSMQAFPYFLFHSSSLADFLAAHSSESLSIMLMNCLCKRKDPSPVLNLFKRFDGAILKFIGTFLACFYSQGTKFNQVVSFNSISIFVQKLYVLSTKKFPLEEIIKKGLPEIFSECLVYYQANDDPANLPFVVDTDGIQACFSTLLAFQANGKFIEPRKRFEVNVLLTYFKSSGILQEFFLHTRKLLYSSGNYHEERRLLHAYRYVWRLFNKFSEEHLKAVVVSTSILTLTSRLNVILQQIVVNSTSLLTSLATTYVNLLSSIYVDALDTSRELLFDDGLSLHLSSCLIYAAFSVPYHLGSSHISQFNNTLQDFLSLVSNEQNSSQIFRYILSSTSKELINKNTLQVLPTINIHMAESVVEIITKSANFDLFYAAWSVVLEGLIRSLTKTIQNLARFPTPRTLLLKAYNAISSLPIVKLGIENVSAECLRTLGVASTKNNYHWEPLISCPLEKHPVKQTFLALCDAYMLEGIDKARVVLNCLLNVSKCKEFRQVVNSDIPALYRHFLSSFLCGAAVQCPSKFRCTPAAEQCDLWLDDDSYYEQWICTVTTSLIDRCNMDYFQQTRDVCRIFPSICRHMLPQIFIHLLSTKHRTSLIQSINFFLSLAASNAGEKKCCCMLDVIEYLRSYYTAKRCANIEKPSCGPSKKKTEDLTGIDLLLLAETAISCNEPTTALLYLELWAGSDEISMSQSRDAERSTRCLLDKAQSAGPNGRRALAVATSAFSMLNDLEALRGCHSISSSSNLAIVSLHQMENNWLAALQAHDLHKSSDGEVLRSLQECGFQHVGDIYARSLEDSRDQQIEELRYKSAWQCGQWDEMTSDLNKPTTGFHKLFYINLLSLRLSHSHNFDCALRKLQSACINSLSRDRKRFVNFDEVKSVFVQLECLNEAEAIFKFIQSGSCASSHFLGWRDNDLTLEHCSYHDVSFLSSSRTSLLRVVAERYNNEEINELRAFHYLDSIKAASKLGRLQHSKQVLHELESVVESMLGEKKASWKYRAKLQMIMLMWQEKEESFALSMLRSLLDEIRPCFNAGKQSSEETLLLASILHTAGTWLDALKYEGASVIMNDYFKQSTILLEEMNPAGSDDSEYSKQLVESHLSLAKFADRQLQEVIAYKSTREYVDKCDYAASPSVDAKKSGNSMSKKTSIIIEKNYHIDKQELNAVERNELDFLLSALNSYMRCLQLSDQYDALLHRICALWFDHQSNAKVNSFISESHSKLPSYKYVSLCYQLSARLAKSDSRSIYAQLIEKIVTRLAIDHPHHALPVVLALVNAHKDSEVKEPVSPSLTAVIEAVRRGKPTLVSGNEKLMDVYIDLANFDASPWRNQVMKLIEFPRSIAINRFCSPKSRPCQELKGVVIPVCELSLDKSAKYENLPDHVMFSHFQQGFKTCGGINIPKVVVALAMDGRKKRHLVKGKDDLRQDAVMQQVFELVNILFSQRSRSDKISMRVYKVIPLTQQSGVVEWCEDTLPIGSYLAGNPVQNLIGAHARLRPDDLQVLTCRKKLVAVARQPMRVKFKTYEDICSKFSPVFRNFCIEKFLDPQQWFFARRRYTRSVAVSSMVGYMVGLGDRHVQNILIDTNNAEVIHIDLGVAFEQGRCLPTPETVPFRLTRDIVDGMGVTGVEGLFRKCCEETLTLLRTSFDVIIPVMEVLLYDPLHDWTMPPVKATHAQKQQADGDGIVGTNSDHPTNKLAARALLRVKEKLKGNENGSVLSVPGQVNMLIQQAMDPRKLCQLFSGWQPYL